MNLVNKLIAGTGLGLALAFGAYACERNVGQRGIDVVKKFEGYRTERYSDVAGNATIGYGHLIRKGESYTKINEQKAEELLREDLKSAENAVRKYVKVDLNDGQFDALVSFVYNVGAGNFEKSTLLKRLNDKDFEGAASEFSKWRKSGGKVVQGLTNRRAEERKMFEMKWEK